MDSQIRALYRKIQRKEIRVEDAASEVELIRARHRHVGRARLISPPATDNPAIAAVYHYDEPCLRDHQVNRQRILPGLTFASLALEYGLSRLAAGEALRLDNLTFAGPVALGEGECMEVAIRATDQEGLSFEAVCRPSALAAWRLAASGGLSAQAARQQPVDPGELMAGMTPVEPLPPLCQINAAIYLGDSYQTLAALYQRPDGGSALSRVALAAVTTDAHVYSVHPLLLNSAFLTVIPLFAGELDHVFIPFGIQSLILHRRPLAATGWIHARLVRQTSELLLFDAEFYSDDGALIMELDGCSLKRLRGPLPVSDVPPDGRAAIEDYLLAQLPALGAKPVSKQQRHRNLMDLGLTSAQLVSLSQRIASAGKIEIAPTVLFEYPSIAELASYLWQAHGAVFAALPPGPGASSPVVTVDVRDRGQEIAIIGMQGRFAAADDLDQFWQNIWQERELIREVPADHWDLAPWFDADPAAQDKTYSRWGSFIDGVDRFDADFFHLSRREAQWMDPQVRLLLQSAWGCAEHAGVIRQLRGSRTGVFVGSCFNDYLDKITELGLPMDPYIATGSGTIAANRISFWFDLKGPSLMFNTACSSSLVALHAACVSLNTGECEMALVGASNLLLSSWRYRYFSAIRALSPTGRCHTFDARADGYTPGECVATLLLKPLARALADGDPVHGVIKGSAAQHGGYTPSLTAPSVTGEEDVIVRAWQNAGIDPRSLSYIEAHGTGTRLGDPVEINALKRAFARYTRDRGFCHIGSVKANIGHAEGAAGIAGVLKVLAQMKHGKLPVLGHFKQQNPHIQLEDSPLVIDTGRGDWPAGHAPRRAGVSSFGFSGTNAHVVIEEYREQREFALHQGETVLVPLTAGNVQRLQEQAARLLAHLAQHTPDLAALAYTLQTGREPMTTRAMFMVDSLTQLQLQLQAFCAGNYRPDFGPASMTDEDALAAGDLRQLAALWLAGADSLDWGRLYGAGPLPARIGLPGYAFARDRYWLEAPPAADSAVATYAEHWRATDEPMPGAPIEKVICLLGEPLLRQQLTQEVRALSRHTGLVFIAADDQPSWQENLQQALSVPGRCRVLYLWSMDDRRRIRDSRPMLSLLRTIAATETPVERVLLAGRANDALDRCHLESWIGIARSLGALMPDCPVDVAIDLGDDNHRWLRRLWLQLSGAATGARLYQNGQVFRTLLEPCAIEAVAEPLVPERLNTLLITGGLGELGLLLAGELSRRARQRGEGPLKLILNGRSPLSAARQAQLDSLRHDQCVVFYLRTDCSDREAMAAQLAGILPQSGPIEGLIHAAGVKATGSLLDSSSADVAAVLAPKVTGTRVLDELLAQQPLRLICHFSSCAAMLGDMGAASYAMANRFQQAYGCLVQRERVARVVTIHWPLWRAGGMAVGDPESTAFYLESSGQRMLESAEGLSLLWKIIAGSADQVLVLAGEPAKLQQRVAAINDIVVRAMPAQPVQQRAELKGLSLEQALLWDLRDLASRPLHADPHTLGADRNLADFGFDSISLTEYAGLLSRHFGLKLTPELFFSHPTLAKIASHLLMRHRPALDACYPHEAPRATEALPLPPSVAAPDVDAIAIIGISGRFPGARNPDELWQALVEGRDNVAEIPLARYDWRAYYGDPRQDPGKTRCIWMGSVPGVDEFDPLFFEISPREARTLDPRQRLLLQESWNVLEDAGIGPRQLATQRVGIFVGVEEGDFQRLAGDESLTARHNGILASRLAYFLDLGGPVMALNTACSSALVALHQAAASLRNHECELAIVGGVNLIFSPDAFIGMTQAGMLSPDGKCFTFDQRANGMVPGEAVCCVLLKPQARAEADGDPIRGVLRASGINYDGKTNGIAAPSGLAQQRLLQDIYRRADIDTERVEYIVTHGTGTQLGDPVEINALNDAFRGNRPGHCALTSTKTNFGHTFAASGLLSVISLLQAFRHETIPASLHCEQENDYIDWHQSPFYVNKRNQPWPDTGRPRLGAVSAFGMSGTNAHVVLQSHRREVDVSGWLRPCYLLVLSARTAGALRDSVERLSAALDAYDDDQLPSISHTLLDGRHHFRHRLALVVADLAEARICLGCYLSGEKRPNLFAGQVEREFAGQKTIRRYIRQLQDDSRYAAEEETRELLYGLADFYRQGYDIDGRRLFVTPPARVALPTYPFAREHYWPAPMLPAPGGPRPLHPLVHQNISTLNATRFVSRFSGHETFLQDHRIGEQLVFPATALLELAREAIVQASERSPQRVTLHNLVWLRPLAFARAGDHPPVGVYCALNVSGADRLSFKIYSLEQGIEQVHAQGDARLLADAAAPPAALDLPALAASCRSGERGHDALYRDFASLGVHYGATFRAARRIRTGPGRVLGQLSGAAADPAMADVWLPPGVLDSALHIASALGDGPGGDVAPALPFALDSLQVYGSVAQALGAGPLTAIATRGDARTAGAVEKIDLQICTDAGECLVRLEGFSSRKTGVSAPPLPGCLIRTPFWQALERPGERLPADCQPQLLLLGLPSAVVDQIRRQCGDRLGILPGDNGAAAFREAALALFEYLQRAVPGYVQLYVGQRPDDPRLSALDAMLQTAMIENPGLRARLVAIDPAMGDEALIRTIVGQQREHRDEMVRILANGSLHHRQWRDLTPTDDEISPLRDGGTYAMTGGAGGLGLIFAEHIARACRQPRLYLAGRSAASPQLQEKTDRLQALGARVHYQTLDVANHQEVRRWIDQIHAEAGELHGVMHCAGEIHDHLIIHQTVSAFERVLAAKVAGIEALDLAIGQRPLDFILCCSSGAAMGNLGQVNYAVASAYMDAYMHYRQQLAADGQRQGRSLSINWPLWRDGGMRVSPEIEQRMRQQSGIAPLPAEVGLRCLRQLLSQPAGAQGWVMYGELSRLGAPAVSTARRPPKPAATPVRADQLKSRIAALVTEIVAGVSQIDAAKIHPAEKFEAYGFDSIMAVGVTQALEQHLGPLPKTLLFEHVNIAGLTDHLAEKYPEHFAALCAGGEPQPEPAVIEPAVIEPAADKEWTNAVAVIGLGGYYPGAANLDELWRNLANGIDCMSDFPPERWDHSKIYSPDRKVLGKTTCRNGAFIADVDAFDYSYFKMPKVYADHMSPEVRLFLQTAVHTFEDAGYSRETLLSQYGGDVGVLVGAMSNDYHYYGFENNLFRGSMASGSGMATIPMTVSYFYGLTGPSLFIDTMCSSSSTCIHTACRMLRHDETKMVLAGGVNLIYHPYTTVMTSQGNFTSATATSVNSYGVGADGTVIGEGVGAVLLKRLDRAIADRDQIHGVITGSAISNAGERNGFNVPNPEMQTLAIRQALEQARAHPSSISYVEGHGSGTRLGDPIEVLGLTRAFAPATGDKQFCHLGSIKSNIGHLLAASGIAGLTKTLLQLRHRQIAPSIHSARLNPDIDFAATPFRVPQQLTEWRQPERIIDGRTQVFPRRAGITSIAAGGMNAHMIVEEYPPPADGAGQITDERLVFVFSVHKLSQLAQNLTGFRDWLTGSAASLAQIAYTLQVGKNTLRNRLAIRCHSRQALLDALAACILGRFNAGADSNIGYHWQDQDALQSPACAPDDPLAPLLTQWLNDGARVDWASLYARLPQRVSLPVYLFEKTRCWYSGDDAEPAILNPLMFANKLHPLVTENCSGTQAGAMFRSDFIEAELLDYVYSGAGGRRISLFNLAEVARVLPALAARAEGGNLSVSCAFEHHIGDWSTVTGLEYRLSGLDGGPSELEFDVRRRDEAPINLGFALIRPLGADAAPRLPDPVRACFNHPPSAADVSQRLAAAGYDFSPYLNNGGDLTICRHGLALAGRTPVHRHNPRADQLQLSPYLATTIEQALVLLLAELGLPAGRVIVRAIERLCCHGRAGDRFVVILTPIGLLDEELSLGLWVLDQQARICLTADRVGLHLGEPERAGIRRDHDWFGGEGNAAEPIRAPIDQRHRHPRESGKPRTGGGRTPRHTATDTMSPPTLALSPPGESILAFIQQELRARLGFAPQETGESAQVHDLGLDSIMIMQLTDSVNKRFGAKLTPDLFYEKQRLGELAARLAGDGATPGRPFGHFGKSRPLA